MGNGRVTQSNSDLRSDHGYDEVGKQVRADRTATQRLEQARRMHVDVMPLNIPHGTDCSSPFYSQNADSSHPSPDRKANGSSVPTFDSPSKSARVCWFDGSSNKVGNSSDDPIPSDVSANA